MRVGRALSFADARHAPLTPLPLLRLPKGLGLLAF